MKREEPQAPAEPWEVVEWWDRSNTHYKLMSSGVVWREISVCDGEEVWLPVAETILQVSISEHVRLILTAPDLIVKQVQPQLIVLPRRRE